MNRSRLQSALARLNGRQRDLRTVKPEAVLDRLAGEAVDRAGYKDLEVDDLCRAENPLPARPLPFWCLYTAAGIDDSPFGWLGGRTAVNPPSNIDQRIALYKNFWPKPHELELPPLRGALKLYEGRVAAFGIIGVSPEKDVPD